MIVPQDFDLAQPDDVLVEQLLETGAYDEQSAQDLIDLLRDPDGEPLE